METEMMRNAEQTSTAAWMMASETAGATTGYMRQVSTNSLHAYASTILCYSSPSPGTTAKATGAAAAAAKHPAAAVVPAVPAMVPTAHEGRGTHVVAVASSPAEHAAAR